MGEYNSGGTAVQETIYLGDMPVGIWKANTRHYIHADHLNTARAIVNQTNTVIWLWKADPFGTTNPTADPDGDGKAFAYNLRFPGQYFDQETGLFYNYFRDYDPRTGRYVKSDPIGLGGGLNTYAYVKNNPLRYIDPLGLYWFRQSWQEPGVVGREGTIVPPGDSVSEFIERSVPAGYTFGEMHDAFVEDATNAGFPDWLVNIPSMIPMSGGALGKEILRDLGILEQPVPASPESGPCK